MTWRELERLLREDGWSVLKRHGGSHMKYQHALKPGTRHIGALIAGAHRCQGER